VNWGKWKRRGEKGFLTEGQDGLLWLGCISLNKNKRLKNKNKEQQRVKQKKKEKGINDQHTPPRTGTL